MITFHLLTATEFMRYKVLEIDFDNAEDKTIAVVGENGTGKSAMYEALHWCLFGSTVRKAMNVHRRAEKTKPTIVVVLGDKDNTDFRIMRSQKSGASKITINVAGKLIDLGSLNGNQKYINDFLGMDSTYFMATTLLGHNSFRFSRATDTDRKALLEDLLGLNKYSTAQECTKTLYGSIEDRITEKTVSMSALSDYVKDPAEADVDNNAAKTVLKNTIKKHDNSINRLNTLLDKQQQQITKHNVFSITNITVSNARDQLRAKKAVIENDMTAIQTQTAITRNRKICPTCLREFTGHQITEQITKFTDRYHELKEELATLNYHYQLCDDFIAILDELDTVEKEKESAICELQDLIKEQKIRETAYTDVKKREQKIRADIAKNKRDVSTLIALNEHVMFWINGFGRQGLISIKLDEAIDELNSALADLSHVLTDGTISVTLGSTTALKRKAASVNKISLMCIVDNEDALYNELSNGQRQKVDVLVMLAVSRLIASRTSETNLLFCDEIDEGLDEGATKLLFNFVADYTNNVKFIAAHTPSVYLRADEVWKLTSKHNITTIVKE